MYKQDQVDSHWLSFVIEMGEKRSIVAWQPTPPSASSMIHKRKKKIGHLLSHQIVINVSLVYPKKETDSFSCYSLFTSVNKQLGEAEVVNKKDSR